MGDIATFSALYTTRTTETNNKVNLNIFESVSVVLAYFISII